MTATVIAGYKGRFQIWSYTVGHMRLLLRSPKSAERPTQVDVLFKNVAAIRLPVVFDDLEILELSTDDWLSPPELGP